MTHERTRYGSGSNNYYIFTVLLNINDISKDSYKHHVIRKKCVISIGYNVTGIANTTVVC